ncbi:MULTISPECIES: HSP18 transcriptional regulator [Amycolatopsis]|uniref:HSP18 transcriptional regulator n=1 Tax=Amycolatopsis dendrobii TaxID=2760662 RepID=A0A7W3VWP9_9PSEU|nr:MULTISPECIES: HSP18 transcriptional regulator [Amycolatopsis]MBB1154611.1 HSP18 transcriptional regulator [Amycolatopsis dendrobii]UKD56572.1 HSP18 transcriptional regulator [Amycolatopsis sp. FU40]
MAEVDPGLLVEGVRAAVLAARDGGAAADRSLAALSALRALRDQLGAWEPELIAAARAAGASWAALAPALGVASRQAAERRYLRLRPSATGEATGEARVDAERGRRAGDRAVADWARRNAAVLRQLAAEASSAPGLDPAGQESADRLGVALGDDDVTNLLPPLADVRVHLEPRHAALADRVGEIAEHTDRLREDAAGQRRGRAR